ncbi:MAG: DUF58 domain-containing protein [Planctomycetes bacterium]|nr:DUF58 domain-containing protein [Planctomycetota bacterium]
MTPGRTTSSSRYRLTDLLDSRFMARLDAVDVLSRKIVQGKLKGERHSKRRGQSIEFADHRQYVPGDDLRFLDWNIYGRLDQLFLKLFLEEQDLSLNILIDLSASMSMGEPRKDLALKRLAAALGYIGLVNNNRVTLSAFADGVVGQLANMRGRNYVHQMVEFLLTRQTDGPTNFEKACRQLAAGRLGSGVTVVLSDFLFKEGYDAGLKRLGSDRYDLYMMQMLSPQERDPDLVGDLKLVDVEDGDFSEVTISSALVKYYKQNLAAYCNELRQFCVRRGATYVLTDSSQPIERLVLEQLRRRGLLA